MLVSTRGRYALRFMIELAERGLKEFVPLKDISEKQGISLKYLESIASDLTKAELIVGVSGRLGGYKINVDPKECSVKQVLAVTEGDVAPVSCLKNDAPACSRAENCRTLPLWEKLHVLISDFFSDVTLSSLCQNT